MSEPVTARLDPLPTDAEREPEDARSVFDRARSYFDLHDFVNARKWYARRVEIGGADEEVYSAMLGIADSIFFLGAPWPDVQNALLRAWEFRPTRAEPLFVIASRYRGDERYRLGYLFAKLAAEIPFPEQEAAFVRADIYAWCATDEQALCASWIDKHAEAFTLWRSLLARPDVPDDDRQRIAANRDVCVPTMIDAASAYPDALVQRLQHLVAGSRDAEVVVSLVAGPDRASTEQTLNSFLRCCTDVSRVGRFLVVDAGLSAEDRAMLLERYRFLEFVPSVPGSGSPDGPSTPLAQIRAQIDGRFWLHLGQGWRFFAPENFITRLTAVLEAEPQVFQVGINFGDAAKLTGACPALQAVCRASDAGSYVLADVAASGPAMFDTARVDRAGGVDSTDPDPIAELGRRAAAAGLRTASLDEVLCITEGRENTTEVAEDTTTSVPTKISGPLSDAPPGFLITGPGRCGTLYIATVLQSCGLNVGHEAWWTVDHDPVGGLDGDVSWHGCFDDGYSGPVYAQVRNPLVAIPSIHGWVWPYLARLLVRVTVPLSGDWAVDAALIWLEYTRHAVERAKEYWRVENLTAELLSRVFDVDPDLAATVLAETPTTNHRRPTTLDSSRRAAKYPWPDHPVVDKVVALGTDLGYAISDPRR